MAQRTHEGTLEFTSNYTMATKRGKAIVFPVTTETVDVSTSEVIEDWKSVNDKAGIAYSVSQNLTNVSSSNENTSVSKGDSFTTTLTADEDYTLDTPKVKVQGASATYTFDDTTGTITIKNIYGNVTLTATATAEEAEG